MVFEYINVNGRLAKVNDEDRIEVKKMNDEIKTELYFVKLTDTVFVDCNKEIVMAEQIQNSMRGAFDDLNWVREVAEDMNGIIYQVVLKDTRCDDADN